jgi:hypothetical protein
MSDFAELDGRNEVSHLHVNVSNQIPRPQQCNALTYGFSALPLNDRVATILEHAT